MKRLLTFILTIIISVLICILCVSFSIKEVVVNTLSKEVVKKEISSYVTNAVKEIDETIDYETLNEIETSIGNSEEIDKITEKYFNNIVDAVINDKEINLPNTKEEIINLINQNESILVKNDIELTNEQKNQIVDLITKDGKIDKIYINISNKIIDNMSDTEIKMVETYNAFISMSFRWIIIGIIILLTVLIALIKKTYYRWTFNLAVAFVIAGALIALLLPFTVETVMLNLTEKFIGSAATINLNKIINLGYICFAVCAVFIASYIVGNKVTNYSERKRNY